MKYFTKKRLVLTLLILNITLGFSQNGNFWKEKEEVFSLTDIEKEKYDAVIIEDNKQINFVDNAIISVYHKIVAVITTDGLQEFNKIAIYIPDDGTLNDIKARCITSTGKIININKSNIKEMDNYEGNGKLKLYAIEGADVGSQIEYTYTLKTPMYDAGKEYLSMEYKTRNACIIVRTVDPYEITAKSYNAKVEDNYEYKHFEYRYKDIYPIAKEGYSAAKALRVSVEYKLLGTYQRRSIYSDYQLYSGHMKTVFYDFTPKELKKAKSFIKTFEGVEKDDDITLKNLSDFLKQRLTYTEKYSSEYSDILSIVKTGRGNDKGLTKLYCAILKQLNIPFEVHVTCSRYKHIFDQNFPSRYTLDEYLLYFPNEDKYLLPTIPYYHYGMVPSWLLDNNAIVISSSSNFIRSPRFQKVKGHEHDFNQTHKVFKAKLDLENNQTTITTNVTLTGQRSLDLNTDYFYSKTDEQKNKVIYEEAKTQFPDSEIIEAKAISPNEGHCPNISCPQTYTVKVNSNAFFEQAGDNLIVNMGMILGPQYELYSEDKRITPVITFYEHSYIHEIEMPIPEGYSYEGSQDIEFNNVFVKNSERVTGFISSIKVENNTIKIHIYEFYSKLYIDKTDYENWRLIVNSAANFNKGTILLKKK